VNRTPLIAGNWKMYKTVSEALTWVKAVLPYLPNPDETEVAVAPSFTALYPLAEFLKESHLKLAAQDVFWEKEGAYTGEVSPTMLKDIGCEYVIIGHSERRQYFGETDEIVAKKVKAAFTYGLKPILCIGERLEEREKGETFSVVKRQLFKALTDIEKIDTLVIAYEPVWAIGTGKTALPAQAQEVHAYLRQLIAEKWGEKANNIRILYGGSVKPENIKALMAEDDIDGVLVGGASLIADSFIKIMCYGVR